MSEDPEDLRRRLYRRDASTTDVDAYRAVAPRSAAPVLAAARPRRNRGVALLLPGSALVAAATTLLLLQPSEPAPAPTPTRPVAAVVVDVQRAAAVASTTEAEREGFVRALEGTRPAGLVDWSGAAGWSAEYRGRGDASMRLALPPGGGRVEVLVVASRTAGVSWTLRSSDDRPIDRRSLYVTPGDVARGALRYPAGRVPARLVVTAPSGVRWGAAVLAEPPGDAQRSRG